MQYKTAFQKYGDFMLSSKLRKVWFVVGGELLVLQYSDIPNRSRTLLAFKGHYSTLVVAELTATMLGGFLALWRQSLRPWHSFSSGGGQEYSISIPMFLPSKNGSLFAFFIQSGTSPTPSGVPTIFGPKGQKIRQSNLTNFCDEDKYNVQCIFWFFDKVNVLSRDAFLWLKII